jgi:hypothetical protein
MNKLSAEEIIEITNTATFLKMEAGEGKNEWFQQEFSNWLNINPVDNLKLSQDEIIEITSKAVELKTISGNTAWFAMMFRSWLGKKSGE